VINTTDDQGAVMQTLDRPSVDLTDSYCSAIAHFATGVTVITTTTTAGPVGMTASAVTSLSLDPLQLLACIRTESPTRAAIEESGRFVVNVLGAGAKDLALRFATPGIDKFANVGQRDDHNLPVLRDAIAYFICDLSSAVPGGDHSIMIGDVVDCGHTSESEPLVYFARQFGEVRLPSATPPEPSAA
jgi:3-hydroxy-9,10-secoandrosta-1,3,5(10)-triene-9,17-dione monooxygenase reductase component